MRNFDLAFEMLLGNEGNYSDNPADLGGETMYGVTKRVAEAHGYSGLMRDLPLATAKQITKSAYWDVYHCDEFPLEIGFAVFDAAYNGGHPAQWLQQAAGVPADGKIGPETVKKVLSANPDRLVMRFDAYRLKYMVSLGAWRTFSGGWANRIADNLIRAAQ